MAREALVWALQRSWGTGLRDVPSATGILASSSLEMATEGGPRNRTQTMAPDPHQASRRHGPDVAPVRAAEVAKGTRYLYGEVCVPRRCSLPLVPTCHLSDQLHANYWKSLYRNVDSQVSPRGESDPVGEGPGL